MRNPRRLAFPVLALAMLAVPQAAMGAQPSRITRPVAVTTDELGPSRTYSSPFVLVDPANRLNVVASFVEMRTRRCGLLRSTDGGQTWSQLGSSPSLPSYPFCFHTSGAVTQTPLAFGRDSRLYYGLVGWDTQDGGARGNISVLLARSDNLGDTWQTTVVRDARGRRDTEVENNRPVSSLVVDTKSGSDDVVYVGWRSNYPNARPEVASRPMVAVSTDGGRTFSPPTDAVGPFFQPEPVRAEVLASAPPPTTSTTTAAPTTVPGEATAPTTVPQPQSQAARVPRDTPTNFGGNNPGLAVDREGALYVAWVRSTANITPSPDQPMYLSRSTDQGKTFTVTQIAPPNRSYGTPILAWSPEGGPDGSLHVVYQGKRPETLVDDVFYRRSTDGGKTWSEAKRLPDDDPTKLISQFLPSLSVAPNGRLDAAWWDFRDDPGTYVNDVYYTSSTDSGRTWAKNIRVTDRSVNRKIGPWSNNFDLRQPPGIASNSAYALLAWDDTRNGDPVGQAQDVFGAAVQYEALAGGTSNALKYVIAGVIAIMVVGAMLLVLALAARRRVGDPAATRR